MGVSTSWLREMLDKAILRFETGPHLVQLGKEVGPLEASPQCVSTQPHDVQAFDAFDSTGGHFSSRSTCPCSVVGRFVVPRQPVCAAHTITMSVTGNRRRTATLATLRISTSLGHKLNDPARMWFYPACHGGRGAAETGLLPATSHHIAILPIHWTGLFSISSTSKTQPALGLWPGKRTV